MQELDEFINKVKHLPPAPKVLPELLALLNKPNIDTSKVVKLIAFDPGLSVAVLQATNSAFFATGSPTADIQEAVQRLGFSQIFQIVCAVTGGKSLAPPQKGYGIDRGELWKHSVTAAVAAQLIARKKGDDENTVFTATLLHDIGKIVLSEALSTNYDRVIEEVEKNQRSLQEAEKKAPGSRARRNRRTPAFPVEVPQQRRRCRVVPPQSKSRRTQRETGRLRLPRRHDRPLHGPGVRPRRVRHERPCGRR